MRPGGYRRLGFCPRKISKGRGKKKINPGWILFIICVLVFAFRFVTIMNKKTERGALSYVQMLNFSIPLVEKQVYKEGAYAENIVSLKSICLEALGLNNISSLGIINNEVSYFKQDTMASIQKPEINLNPFSIDDSSITKVDDGRVSPAYNPKLKKEINHSKPEVLIYHSHTTEDYAKGADGKGGTVVEVGNVLERELEEKYGISVIHDKTNHAVVYDNSYMKSRETVKKYLNKYGDFKLIIDLHRDSVSRKATTVNMNGENLSKMMFVTAKNSQIYNKNQALADKYFNTANKVFPGLARNNYIYESGWDAFNLNLNKNCLILECGSNTNTIDESKASAKYIARLIAENLNK